MAREDMDHIILRPGELHVVMAQLLCIGAYIENSGLDFCRTETDLYRPITVKQILEAYEKRSKRICGHPAGPIQPVPGSISPVVPRHAESTHSSRRSAD